MKKYHFSEYDGNAGKDLLFDTKEEALDFARYSWNHTTPKERERLSWCYVAEMELTEAEIEAFNRGDCPDEVENRKRVIWNMGEEVRA